MTMTREGIEQELSEWRAALPSLIEQDEELEQAYQEAEKTYYDNVDDLVAARNAIAYLEEELTKLEEI